MKQARLSEEAEEDLTDIWEYIAADNPGAARKTVRSLVSHYNSLAYHPFMGRPREEFLAGLRSYGVGNYLIFYKVIPEGIAVIRILHGARDLQAIFNAEPLESSTDEE